WTFRDLAAAAFDRAAATTPKTRWNPRRLAARRGTRATYDNDDSDQEGAIGDEEGEGGEEEDLLAFLEEEAVATAPDVPPNMVEEVAATPLPLGGADGPITRADIAAEPDMESYALAPLPGGEPMQATLVNAVFMS